MDAATNPYAPGAGTRPPLLAGRDDLVATATVALTRAKHGRAAKSFVAVGLRGVGKTVILNKVADLAEESGYLVAAIEAYDEATLATMLVPRLRTTLLKLSRVEGAMDIARRGLAVLRNFATGLRVQMGEVELGFDFKETAGVADTGSLANDLPELFVTIGGVARDKGTAIALIIDDVQYLSEEELGALIMAMHQVSQKGLPIVMVAAGLPLVLGKMGQTKSYAERLFDFPPVNALCREDAHAAIAEPALQEGVVFTKGALDEIYGVTEGYPYFLQEWGFVAWSLAQKSPIDRDIILASKGEAVRRLDESFFRVRLDRMTPTERRYMRAMAELGKGPHTSGDIAKAYGAKVTTIAPIRSSLISKGMIFSPSYSNTDFTVPMFDEFMRREMPVWQ